METCFVIWDLLKRRSQLFVPTFSGFWPKPLILWFLLELFFWFCRVFLGWWGFWGIYLGHSCRLTKDSHVHFMCVFFRALYFIMKVLLDFMRAIVWKCSGEHLCLDFYLYPLLVHTIDLLCIIFYPKLHLSMPFNVKKK